MKLIQRVDDAEDTIRRRLEVYRTETSPLMDYYRGQGRLREIPGLGTVDDVYRSLMKALGCNGQG
jgi:adenylate kinase